MKATRLFYSLFICLTLSGLNLTALSADDVTDSVQEGLAYYQQENYVEAANSLEYAAQLIRQKRSGNLEAFLPEPLAGWQQEDSSSQALGSSLFGGATSASRTYTKDNGSLTVSIVADSPMLQSLAMLLSNPMFASADGSRLQRINGQKAIIKYDAQQQSGEVKIIVGGQILVTIEGSGVVYQDLLDYASAVSYDQLPVT